MSKLSKFIGVILLMVYLCSPLAVAQDRTRGKITMEFKNEDITSVFMRLEKVSGYKIMFVKDDLKSYKATGSVVNASITDAVKAIIGKNPLGFSFQKNTISIYLKGKDVIKKVEGVVLFDEDGSPVIGAYVRFKDDLSKGTSTDMDGLFTLQNVDKKSKIVISYVGMEDVVVNASEKIKVRLKSDSQTLDEVVVTGMFNRKIEGFSGAASTIKGDDIKKYSTTNIAKALSAVDPSFRIMENIANGSDPNKLPELNMRGQANMPVSSKTSGDVLALQGEYQTFPNQPLIIMDGFEISIRTMMDLDPDRIASITLLKDAAATSIYGSRAANGVVVIESKTPKAGKLWVTYAGEFRLEAPDLTAYNLMNSTQKLEAEVRAGVFSSGQPTQDSDELYQRKLREVKRGVNTYWLSRPLQTSLQQRHTVTLEGGTPDLRYRMYIGMNHNPGVMKGSKRDVFTGALDLQYRFKKVLFRNSFTVDNSTNRESNWGSFRQYALLNPYFRPYGPDGEVVKKFDTSFGISGIFESNPVYNTTFKTKNGGVNLTVRELFHVEYNPIRELRIEGNASLSKSVGHSDRFRPAMHTAFDRVNDPSLRGDYNKVQSEALNWELNLGASYNKSINDIHFVTANTRFTVDETSTSSYSATLVGFPNENMDDLSFGKRLQDKMTGFERTSRSIGWIAAMGYSYKYKYSADFNIRLDGSSQFGKNNRWAPFWSAGLRWDVKKEKLLSNVDFISDMILRASYGVMGSQGFNPYQAHEYYTYSNLLRPYRSSTGTGAELLAMSNENLKWQETNTWNAGLEVGFLNKRITARVDLYRKITKNTVTEVSLDPSLGFESYPENLGEMENKGIELSLSFIPYQDRQRQAYWVVTLNGGRNKNKLLKISEAMRHLNELNSKRTTSTPLPRYEEGRSLSSIWVVQSLGIDPADGMEIFLKRNGDITQVWDPVDMIPIGDTEPTWRGNINSSFSYKGFGVDVSLSYRTGAQIYNGTLVDRLENASVHSNLDARALELTWSKRGDLSKYRRILVRANDTKASSRFVMNEKLLQMNSISVNYRMDKSNAKFLDKLGLASAKLSLSMEDVFYISSVKRERGIDYPFSNRFSFSVNLGF